MPTIAAKDANLLPHSIEAEEAVLGSMLIDPDAVHVARAERLLPGDFFRETNGWIYGAMIGLADRFEAVDFVSVVNALEEGQNEHGSKLDAVGGSAELARLVNRTPTSIHAGHYAQIVKRDAVRRGLIRAAAEVAQVSHEHEGPLDELFDQVSGILFEAMDRPESGTHVYGTDETLIAYLVRQDERAERYANGKGGLVKTWLPDLDHLLGHLRPGELHIPAAKTSVGKTIYMEQLAEANAARDVRVAYYHLELTHERMEDRRMARWSGIPLYKLDEQGYNGPEVAQAIEKIKAFVGNIVYVHCPGWTAERIAADTQRLHARGECDLAIIDYLGKIALSDSTSRYGNLPYAIGHKLDVIKNMAERIEIPVCLGVQVNRDYKMRADKKPSLDDLLGSGDIERFSNQVVILHRPQEREEGDLHGKTECVEAYVEKNTGGATGKVELWHRLGYYRLETPERKGYDF